MTNILTCLTLFCYLATCLRLLAYRRGLGNHRLKIALMAWLLIVYSGGNTLHLLLHPTQVYFSDAALSVALFILVWRARGNVAEIVRSRR